MSQPGGPAAATAPTAVEILTKRTAAFKAAEIYFTNAKKIFDRIFELDPTPAAGTTPNYQFKTTKTRNNNEYYEDLEELKTQITEGIEFLKKGDSKDSDISNSPNIEQPAVVVGGGKMKKNSKKKGMRGGSVPDLVNSVVAFQNLGGLLATATPLDNAQRMDPALYNAGSFSNGMTMPVSSSANLPINYKTIMDGALSQSGGAKSKKSQKSKASKK